MLRNYFRTFEMAGIFWSIPRDSRLRFNVRVVGLEGGPFGPDPRDA
jgi:hypothetical protein